MDTQHPSQPPSGATIGAGQQALKQGAWEEARYAFECALSTSELERSAEVLSGLAEAMWWLGKFRESLDCWERDLELCALTQIGVALIDQGRITEGITFHDEAVAGALAGEGELNTVVFTTCKMMDSYSRCAQYERMAQWIRAADRFVEGYGCPYLNASCRIHYGEVLFATGDWAPAEEELHAALRLSENSLPAVQAKELALLRWVFRRAQLLPRTRSGKVCSSNSLDIAKIAHKPTPNKIAHIREAALAGTG